MTFRIWAPARVVLVLFLLAGTGCGDTAEETATDHHDHGGGTAVTVWTEQTEIFFEYSALIAGERSDPWAVHVTRMSDFSPVTSGSLTLAFRASDGTVFTTKTDAPARAGIFTPTPMLPEAGTYDLVVDVSGPELRDRIRAGRVRVYAQGEEVAPPHDHTDGISYLKEQQWTTDFAVEVATERAIGRSVEVVGEIVPAGDRIVQVAAPVSGLAVAASNRRAPTEGEMVAAGQELATLAPATGSDTYAQAKADIERLEREVQRLTRLFEAEAIPEKRLIDARHELDVARSVLKTLGRTASGYDYALRAPAAGIIHRRHFQPGEYVGVGETLFEIVNMAVVWLRVELPSQKTMLANAAAGASFTVEGSDRLFRPSALVSTGSTVDPETRTLPVIFAVTNDDRSLRFGMFARVMLDVGDRVKGVAIPVDAVQNEDGVPVAYVQVGGETFQRRPLTLGPSDGVHIIVDGGVEPGEHVVTRGAYQVYLASLNTDDFGGHGHPH